jgi:hypothetical protein
VDVLSELNLDTGFVGFDEDVDEGRDTADRSVISEGTRRPSARAASMTAEGCSSFAI